MGPKAKKAGGPGGPGGPGGGGAKEPEQAKKGVGAKEGGVKEGTGGAKEVLPSQKEGKKGKEKEPDLTPNQAKAGRKVAKREMEAARLAERDQMESMCGMDCEPEQEPEEEGKRTIMDSFGNTVSKAKASEDKKMDELRKAAKERRAAKVAEAEAAAAAALEAQSADVGAGAGAGGGAGAGAGAGAAGRKERKEKNRDKDRDVDAVQGGLRGLKLSHKERKALKVEEEGEAEDARAREQAASGLSAFSLSFQARKGYDDDEGPSTVSATDVIAEGVCISAPSGPLLIDAQVRLVSGRRYGLLGPNGK
ncbi:hypothetical protein B484DRAFT_153533, partial [Ochromonadaceae sp. CCMP2298]